MQQHLSFIKELVQKGGPDYSDYASFTSCLQEVHATLQKNVLEKKQLSEFRNAFKDALSPETMQGHSYLKPFGYPGDFQVIDKIYQLHVSPVDHLKKWDIFYHQQKAAKAVRNRKAYFKHLLFDLEQNTAESVHVLDLASGPARDVFEFLCCQSTGRTFFDCVDLDENAIQFAASLCSAFAANVQFTKANVFRFRCNGKYDLIWSAGLFDYLNDRQFVFMLNKYFPLLKPGGTLVIGNFSTNNPTRPYMEVVNDWCLKHRSKDNLIELATEAGISSNKVFIGKEPEGLNLFLHIQKN